MLDGTYGEDRWKWGNLKGGGRGEREREKKESQALGGGRRFLEEQVGP